MEDVSKGTNPTGNMNGSFFKQLVKSTTFRFVLPIIVSAHLGWYYLRKHVVLDVEQRKYVYKEDSPKV